jgi:hypothetical protein
VIGLNPSTGFSGLGNVIEFNGGDGVQVDGSVGQNNVVQRQNSGDSILGNSIYSNGALGIDLKTGGTQAPNDLQPAPAITAVTAGASSAVVQGNIHTPSNPGVALRIELFSSPACGPGGSGEGRTLIGTATATTDGAGNATFSASTASVAVGEAVTATATNTTADPSTPAGSVNVFNTSEFSSCYTLAQPVALVTPPLPEPSNAFVVLSKSVKNGAITLKVLLHATGTLKGVATYIQSSRRITGHGRHRHVHTVRKAILYGQATVTGGSAAPPVLKIVPTRSAAKALKRRHTLALTITVSFSPTGGKPRTTTLPLTVHAPKPKPKHR